jgi:hypothetical protein
MATPTDATHIYNNRRYLYTTTRTWCDSILHFLRLCRVCLFSRQNTKEILRPWHIC